MKNAVIGVHPAAGKPLDRPVLTLYSLIDGVTLDTLAGGVFTPNLLKQVL